MLGLQKCYEKMETWHLSVHYTSLKLLYDYTKTTQDHCLDNFGFITLLLVK